MENLCIKSEPDEETSEVGFFVLQGIKIEEDEQNHGDIKLEPKENVFSDKARNEENRDSSFCTEKKSQKGKDEIKSGMQIFDEELEVNKGTKLEIFNADVMREYQKYGNGQAPVEENMPRCQLLIAKESPKEAALRLADAIAKGPGTAEWKKLPWRQRLMAKKAHEKAALRHATTAAKELSSHQKKYTRQLPEEQLIKLVQQGEAFDEDALRSTMLAATAENSMQWGQSLINKETLQETALRCVEVDVKEPASMERQILWRQRLAAREALEKAALQRIETVGKDSPTTEAKIHWRQRLAAREALEQAALQRFKAASNKPPTTERKTPWRQRLVAKEAQEKAALHRIEAADKEQSTTKRKTPRRQRLLAKEALEQAALQRIEAAATKPPTTERKTPWRQRLVAKETPKEAALRRAKAAAQKQHSRQAIRARQTSEERESQRLQEVSRIRQIRLRQQAKETLEEAAERRAKAVTQKQRSRRSKRARKLLKEQESQCLENDSRIPQLNHTQEATGTLEEAALNHSAFSTPTHESFKGSKVPAHDCDKINTECQICHSTCYATKKSADTSFKKSCHKGDVSKEKRGKEVLQFPPDLKDILSEGFSNLLNTWNP